MEWIMWVRKVNFLLMALLLAGCSGTNHTSVAGAASELYSYEAEFQIISMDQAPYRAVMGTNGAVFFAVYDDMEGTELFYWLPGEKVPKEILPKQGKGTWITAMGSDRKGNLLFACGQYEEETRRLEIIKISGKGELLQRVELSENFKDIKEFEVQYLVGDDKGNFYIANGSTVYAVDPEGKLLYELRSEKKIWDMFFSGDGRMMLLHSGELEELLYDRKKLRPVHSAVSFPDGNYETGQEREVLYNSGDSLYTCNVKDKEPLKLLNWTNKDVNSKNLLCFTALKDGRIAAFTSQRLMERGECELIILEKQKKSGLPEKEIITYGCSYNNSRISSQILRFNKTNKKYRVEIKLYGDEKTDAETVKMLLQKDIASGSGPDIIDIGLLLPKTGHQDLLAMDILENLNPFFEQDGRIRREDYLEQILKVYEKDDCLYAVMPSFTVNR